MTTDRELDVVLKEAGREHRAVGAPERLERVLFAAAESRRNASLRRPRPAWKWAAAAMLIAAIATAGTVWEMRKKTPAREEQVQSAPTAPVKTEAAPSSASAGVSSGLASKAGAEEKKSVVAKTPRRPRESADGAKADVASAEGASHGGTSEKRPRWSSLDEFVELPVSEGLAPAADLSVVRVKLRGSDLQQYGLEAPVDAVARTVLAEFVVGEDGLPRAIRIVR